MPRQLFASPADALRALFEAWPSDKGEGTGLTEAYILAIEGYSLAAIESAVRRIIRGEADDIDPRFLPSPAQVGNLVAHMEKVLAPPKPVKTLPAPGDLPKTEESKRRVAEMARNWSSRAVPSPYDEYDAWQKARYEVPSALPDDNPTPNTGRAA